MTYHILIEIIIILKITVSCCFNIKKKKKQKQFTLFDTCKVEIILQKAPVLVNVARFECANFRNWILCKFFFGQSCIEELNDIFMILFGHVVEKIVLPVLKNALFIWNKIQMW